MNTTLRLFCIYLISALGFIFVSCNSPQHDWENPALFCENCEMPHSTFFVPAEASVTSANTNKRSSHKFQLLNGHWKFLLIPSPDNTPRDFEKTDFKDDRWPNIKVPASWQTQGFGTSIYTNHGKPWSNPSAPKIVSNENSQNPTGLYRKSFTFKESLDGQRSILHFAGVNSAMYVWLNGEKIGYSQNGFSPTEFDISDKLIVGKNTLVVKVLRWSDGSYLDTWDSWRNSGIFRDVFIYQTPLSHIKDFEINADLTENFQDGLLNGSVWISNAHKRPVDKLSLKYELFWKEEKIYSETKKLPVIESKKETKVSFSHIIKSSKNWSAETPNLYNSRISLLLNGKEIEYIKHNTGFRKLEKKGNQFLLNGQPILFKGINRMEIHPDFGRYVPYDVLVQGRIILFFHKKNHLFI